MRIRVSAPYRLVKEGELRLAIDDTLLKRFGPKVFGRCLNYDGSSQLAGPKSRRIAWGNSWVVCGVVVELPFMERPICLPVLFRLWRPGAGPTQVELARELVKVVAEAHPDRRLIVLADGSYAGGALAPSKLAPNVTLVLRARRDIRLFAPPAPRRPGQVGRPRLKGAPLPSLREQAGGGARWRATEVEVYGRKEAVELCEQRGLWYGAWGASRIKAVALRDRREPDQIDMVVISSDPRLSAERIVELYGRRWAIEVAFRDAKQLGGVGEAQNRTRRAVECTAPFAFRCLTVAVVWYALAVAARRHAGEHPFHDRPAERVAVGEVRVGRKRHLGLAVGRPRPRALHRDAPPAERDLALLVTVPNGGAVRVVSALRAHDVVDLLFHQLADDAEPDADR